MSQACRRCGAQGGLGPLVALCIAAAAACSSATRLEVGPDGGGADAAAPRDAAPDGGPSPLFHKALLVVDESVSLQCTDHDWLGVASAVDLVEARSSWPDTSFGLVLFTDEVHWVRFTTAAEAIEALRSGSAELRSRGVGSDYESALVAVRQLVESDLAALAEAERARTRYEILVVGDGLAEPRCEAGCEDDCLTCGDGEDNDGDGLVDERDPSCAGPLTDELHPLLCNRSFEPPPGSYLTLGPGCPAFNTEEQLLRRVEEIVAIGDRAGGPEIILGAVLVFDDQEIVDARCGGWGACFGYAWWVGAPLMQALARAGRGSFEALPGVPREPPDPSELERFLVCGDCSGSSGCLGVPFECDGRFRLCGNPTMGSCFELGGELIWVPRRGPYPEVEYCSCPSSTVAVGSDCAIPALAREYCLRAGGAYVETSEGPRCSCSPPLVAYRWRCVEPEVVRDACEHTGGVWDPAGLACDCGHPFVFLDAFYGCIGPAGLEQVCTDTGGTWSDEASPLGCACPDGRTPPDGNCR